VIVIQEKLKSQVPPWVLCETLLPPVDVEFFRPSVPDKEFMKRYHIGDHEKIIVYHGGANEFTSDALLSLCIAVGIINNRGHRCRLIRSGVGSLEFLSRLPLEITSRVLDLGRLPREQLPKLLSLADVFVQPKVAADFDEMRFPGKVPEFLAMGKPVILPKENISDLLCNGINVIFLDSGTPDDIADKCIALFSNKGKALSLGRAGREVCERNFDSRSQAKKLEKIYLSAMSVFNSSVSSSVWLKGKKGESINAALSRRLNAMAEVKSLGVSVNVHELLYYQSKMIGRYDERIAEISKVLDGRNSLFRTVFSLVEQLLFCTSVPKNNVSRWVKGKKIISNRFGRFTTRSERLKYFLCRIENAHRREGWSAIKNRIIRISSSKR